MSETKSTDVDALHRELDTALGLTKGAEIDLAHLCLAIINRGTSEGAPALLRYLAEHWRSRESSEEIPIDPIVAEHVLSTMIECYGVVVDAMLELQLRANLGEEEFYTRIWEAINNPILPDADARAFALLWIMNDVRVPYFQLSQGLRLTNADWGVLGRKLQGSTDRVRFILAKEFEQRSESADLLLQELDTLEGVERVRVMGFLLWELRRQTDKGTTSRLLLERLR